MQNVRAASIAADNMATRRATAHKLGEEKAAALQHLKLEHGAFRIKVGHCCVYCVAPGVEGYPRRSLWDLLGGFLWGIMIVAGGLLWGV